MSVHKKNIISLLSHGYRHDRYTLFRDWVELMAITLANQINTPEWDEREKRYFEIFKKYERNEFDNFTKAFAELILLFQEEGFNDWLGLIFMELEISNDRSGQFFTPYCLSKMMASLSMQDPQRIIDTAGIIELNEPAIGAGSMVIAAAEELQQQKIDYTEYLEVTGVDVDIRCVHMAYIQLTLLNIPAVIVHGNTLTLEEHSHWYTPAYVRNKNRAVLEKEVIQEEVTNAA